MESGKTVVLIVTHGKLAQALANTMELIVGKIDDIFYINFPKKEHINYLETEFDNFVKAHSNDNIIIFVDVIGGSCFNVASRYLKNDNVRIFCGVNLPILLETAIDKNHLAFNDLITKIDEKLNSFIIDVNNSVKSK